MRRTFTALQRASSRLPPTLHTAEAWSDAARRLSGCHASVSAQPAQQASTGSAARIAQHQPRRGFAADALSGAAAPLPRPLPRPRRLGPPLGRVALPGHGQGSVNAAMAEAPEQYTLLPSPITAPYPKVPDYLSETFKIQSVTSRVGD